MINCVIVPLIYTVCIVVHLECTHYGKSPQSCASEEPLALGEEEKSSLARDGDEISYSMRASV